MLTPGINLPNKPGLNVTIFSPFFQFKSRYSVFGTFYFLPCHGDKYICQINQTYCNFAFQPPFRFTICCSAVLPQKILAWQNFHKKITSMMIFQKRVKSARRFVNLIELWTNIISHSLASTFPIHPLLKGPSLPELYSTPLPRSDFMFSERAICPKLDLVRRYIGEYRFWFSRIPVWLLRRKRTFCT